MLILDLICALLLALLMVVWLTRVVVMWEKENYARVTTHGTGGSKIVKNLMNSIYWAAEVIGRLCIHLKMHSNQVSLASLITGIIAAFVVAFGYFGIGAIFVLVSSLLDVSDGFVARKLGRVSESGALVDTILDRYVELFFFSGLIYYFRADTSFLLLCLAALLGSIMITFTSVKAEGYKITLPQSPMKRAERCFCLFTGSVFSGIYLYFAKYPIAYPMIFILIVIAVLANLSAISRFIYLKNTLRELQ